jgi:hypothetical protein
LTVVSKASAVSTVLSRAPLGLSAPLVRVEVHLAGGLPTFVVVGLPETVVRESRERVRSALVTAGFDFPMMRITVNLSPADLPKAGGRFDLPIALGILAAHGQLPARSLRRREFYGELSLAGDLRETPMLLPALLAGSRAGRELFLPAANGLEASLIAGAQLRLARTCRDRRRRHQPPSRRRRTSPTSAASSQPSGRSRLLPAASTGSCWSGRLVRARRCWRSACLGCCRRSRRPRRSRWRASSRRRAGARAQGGAGRFAIRSTRHPWHR